MMDMRSFEPTGSWKPNINYIKYYLTILSSLYFMFSSRYMRTVSSRNISKSLEKWHPIRISWHQQVLNAGFAKGGQSSATTCDYPLLPHPRKLLLCCQNQYLY